jgi:hypothetical protein
MKLPFRTVVARAVPLLAIALLLPACALFLNQPNVAGWGTTTISIKSPKSGVEVTEVTYSNQEFGESPVLIELDARTEGLSLEAGSEKYALTSGHTYELRMALFSGKSVELWDRTDGIKVADFTLVSKLWAVVARTLTVGVTDAGYGSPTTDKILLEVYYDGYKKVFSLIDET